MGAGKSGRGTSKGGRGGGDYARWPSCGCETRCGQRKCIQAGARSALKNELAHTGVMTQVADDLLTRRYNPETLRQVLTAAAEIPIVAAICRKVGIHRTLLRYWLAISKSNPANTAFNVVLEDGRVERFHILFADAIEAGFDAVEERAFAFATGMEREVLEYQGRVQYKYDQGLLDLGMTGAHAYQRDENGEPIPETIPLKDPEMIRWILARRRADQYGNKIQVEHEHRGGVLVVGATMTPAQVEKTFGGQQAIEDVEFDIVKPSEDGGPSGSES